MSITMMDAPQENRRGENVPVFLLVCHAGNQRLIASHPRAAKVRKQLALKMGGERGRPSQLQFQCTDRFRDDLRRPFRFEERRGLGKAEQRVSKGEVDEDARVKDN